ncbi:MAG TPA: TIM barrel protein, partial [Acidobacteriota bacterium]|nr:TIM barrel protein [Acidobacteriota bacterium]
MNLSLAAYSMRKELTSGQMNLFQFIDWCAEMDLPGTELTTYYFEDGFDAAYLRRLKLHAFRNGVTVSGTAIRNDFCLPPGAERDAEVASVKRWLEYAAELGAPHVRIFAGS